MSLYYKKYSSMTECYFLLSNNLICGFITSLAHLTALGWVSDQSE